MKMRITILLFLSAVLAISCREEKKKDTAKDTIRDISSLIKKSTDAVSDTTSLIKDYHEKDAGDYFAYYRDFDWCRFKGTGKFEKYPDQYPFVKQIKKQGDLILKACYSPTQSRYMTFTKIQGRWVFHAAHEADGITSHFYTVVMDDYILKLDFLGDPFQKKGPYHGLHNITVWLPEKDTVTEKHYLFLDKINREDRFPVLNRFRYADYESKAIDLVQIKYVAANDSLIKITTDIISDRKPVNGNKVVRTAEAAISHSYFFTSFGSIYGTGSQSSFLDKTKKINAALDSLLKLF